MTVKDREWMVKATCRDHDPETFFPNPSDLDGQEYARDICEGCPVAGATSTTSSPMDPWDTYSPTAHQPQPAHTTASPKRHAQPAG